MRQVWRDAGARAAARAGVVRLVCDADEDPASHATPLPRIEPSGSSHAELVVRADAVKRGVSAEVSLERTYGESGTETELVIHDREGSIGLDADGRIQLLHPDALRTLISALLELEATPHGRAILDSIPPRTTATADESEGAD